MHGDDGIGDKDSIRVVPNGDGTVSFRDTDKDMVMTVDTNNHLVRKEDGTGELTDKEKFIIHILEVPKKVEGFKVEKVSKDTIDLSWNYPADSLFTDMVLSYKKGTDENWTEPRKLTSSEMLEHFCTVTGLESNTKYNFKLQSIMQIDKGADGKDRQFESPENAISAETNNETYISDKITIKNAKGGYVKTYSEDGKILTVTNDSSDKDILFKEVKFGQYDGVNNGKVEIEIGNAYVKKYHNAVVQNFISKSYGKGIKTGNQKNVIMDGTTGAGVWESVRVIPNGDDKGTVSFLDSAASHVVTVKDGQLSIDENRDFKDLKNLTEDDKFIIHIPTAPSQVANFKVVSDDKITESTIDFSWDYPADSLFTNMVLSYKKVADKDENCVKKDLTTDEMLGHSCTVTGLAKETEYDFKLQSIMKIDGDVNGGIELKSPDSEVKAATNAKPVPTDPPGTGDVDNTKLQAAYNEYSAYKEADYKTEGWTDFQNALANAKIQLDKGNAASQADVNNALKELNDAAGKLVKTDGTKPVTPPTGVADLDPNAEYAIISKTTGRALDAKVLDGYNSNAIMADVFYDSKSKKIASANAKFSIEKGKSDSTVIIKEYFEGQKYTLRLENNNERDFGFLDKASRTDDDAQFFVEKTEKGTFKIKSYKGRYATVDSSSKGLFFKKDTKLENAEEFTFVNIDGFSSFDNSISIQSKSNGKYVKTYKSKGTALTVNGQKGDEGTVFSKVVFGTNSTTASGEEYVTASFVSKDYENGIKSVIWDKDAGNPDGAKLTQVITDEKKVGSEWESIRIIPNGDGTVSFRDSYFDRYITVQGISLACGKIAEGTTRDKLTDKEKFIIHTDSIPEAVTDFKINDRTRTKTTLDLTWKNPTCIYTSAVIEQKLASEADSQYKEIETLGDEESYTVTGLQQKTDYSFRIRLDFSNGTDTYSSEYAYVSGSTIETDRPAAPSNVHVKESADGVFELTWDEVAGANGYNVYQARSKYDKEGYKLYSFVNGNKATITTETGRDKYSYYFCVRALAGSDGSHVDSEESEIVSLETEMFGEHTVFFAPTDDVKKIDKVLADIFKDDNDFDKDAQFNGQQWQIYFKPGDYTETSCMYLGFYTSFNGLGKTPYDVKLNNIAIPAYLPSGELGGDGNNATCNFWRSAENLSVMFTGNEQGKAKEGCREDREEDFNWAVAQAAPLRRVYSERPVAYDWNYGWASGGYVADCYFVGADSNGNSAGTASGQQFFTRNSRVEGNTYGTTLNNFFMGVEAENNLTSENGTALKNNNGYTNWGIAGNKDANGKIPQQVVTEITSTPKISEKPFLYLDKGEYKIFIPAVQENRIGISWGEGKDNEGMGKGTSLSLSDFYIAKPSDTAKEINAQIEAGKNIYFTPGIYHAEEPIVVNRENAILLGSGMTSIIPDNDDMAMKVGDADGIRIEGLIFDAGLSSKYLLQVGGKKTNVSHSANPIVLQDLFFRVGGTTDVLTKADDAMEINCNDVICDHFWIWRADHGAGVEWYGNESKHGLIVNGDNVNCYALFNEHFQEYHTLWNGENGATYFYQNETCYDPISQDAWMSHGGTVNGYSSYKVSNDVKNHYAVGLGVYNVFIYTGPLYDAKSIGIQLDNAIEVPNSENVLVENACIQTFANDDGALARINHIVNGAGGSASSGYNEETGERGESWSRKFLLYYNNGLAEYGKETDPATFNFTNGNDPKDQRNQFIGTEKRTTENPVAEPEDEKIFLDRIEQLVKELSAAVESDYTKNSWKNAELEKALAKAREMIEIGKQILNGTYNDTSRLRRAANYNQYLISKIQSEINKACTTLEAAGEKLVYIGDASRLNNVCNETINEADYQKNDAWYAYLNALRKVEEILKESEERDISTTKKVYELNQEIEAAYEALRLARLELTGEDFGLNVKELKEAYDKYSAYKQSDYTSASWAGFAKALADARAELDKGTKAVQADVDKALAALNAAAGKLVKASSGGSTNLSKLKEAYNKYAAYKQSDYTSASWADFAKALADAKAELDKGDKAVQADVDKALAALNTAAGKLVKNSNNDNGGGSVIYPGGTSSIDKWLETMLYNALANSNYSNADRDKILEAIAGLIDSKADMDETQDKADALLDAINSIINSNSGTVQVEGIVLDKSSLSLDKEKKVVLNATITPEDATNKDIIWSSDNTKVATVDKNGTVKAAGKGTANITATTADGLKTAVCKITVKVPATKVTMNTKKVYIVKGSTISLKAVMTPSGTTDKIKWSTSKSYVATVKSGKVKAKKTGTAVITAKASSGKKATCKVYVVKKAKKAASVKLDKKKVSIKKGGWILLSAVLKPESATDTVNWKSSNKKVASVDAYGFVKAKKKGKATITVTTGNGKKVTCKVTVK